jgi:hypothetical protein
MKRVNKRDLNYLGTDKAPLHPTTFSIVPTKSGNTILSFAWIPPEKTSEFHILMRVSLPKQMAKVLAEELLKSLEFVEQSESASQEMFGQTQRKKS